MKHNEYVKPEIKAYEMEATSILSGSDVLKISDEYATEDACSNKGFFEEEEY